MQKVYFSNRIYKRDLDNEVVLSIDKLIADYTHCLHTAYNFKIQCSRDPSLVVESDYKYLKDKLNSPNVYILNSAINEAKGLIKSQNELRKLYIKQSKNNCGKDYVF